MVGSPLTIPVSTMQPPATMTVSLRGVSLSLLSPPMSSWDSNHSPTTPSLWWLSMLLVPATQPPSLWRPYLFVSEGVITCEGLWYDLVCSVLRHLGTAPGDSPSLHTPHNNHNSYSMVLILITLANTECRKYTTM